MPKLRPFTVSSRRLRRIEILAFPQAQLLDISGPLQAFATANDLCQLQGNPPPYEVCVVAQATPVETSSHLALVCHRLPPVEMSVHTLLISGGNGVHQACQQTPLIDWITARAAVAERVASVCSGAFLLAQAGLLDGRRVVTHWQRCAELAERFPLVHVDPDPIFIQDGSVWTSAGITAGIDLALALISEDLGSALALAVARQLVVFLKRPGGQAQFSTALALQQKGQGGGRFEALHVWILENLHRSLSLQELADQAGMSVRSFCRHYRQACGQTPARALETLRLEAARRLIDDGVGLSYVVRRCGFGSAETLRRVFLRHLGVGPQAYRERFSAPQ